MNIGEFVINLQDDLQAFESNMFLVEGDFVHRTDAQIMRLFLKWVEWETEVHRLYWDEPEPFRYNPK